LALFITINTSPGFPFDAGITESDTLLQENNAKIVSINKIDFIFFNLAKIMYAIIVQFTNYLQNQ